MEDYQIPEEGANPHPVSEPDNFMCSWAFFEEEHDRNKVVMYCKKNVYMELQLEEVIWEQRKQTTPKTVNGSNSQPKPGPSGVAVKSMWDTPGPSVFSKQGSSFKGPGDENVVPSSASKLPFKVFVDNDENQPEESQNKDKETDLFCPLTIYEEQSFNKKAMYPRNKVYRERQFEEIRAEIYFKNEKPKAVKSIIVPEVKKVVEEPKRLLPDLGNLKPEMNSVHCQSFTVNTLEALNFARAAWYSPEKPGDEAKEEFRKPNPPDPLPPPARPSKLPFGVFTEPSSQENVQKAEKPKKKFDVYCEGEDDKKTSFIYGEEEVKQNANLPMSDDTCTTAAFNFVLPSSTPVSKNSSKNKAKPPQDANGSFEEKKEITPPPQPQPGNNQELSTILESSNEKLSSSGGVRTSKEIDSAMKQLRLEEKQINPFSGELIEFFLNKLKFPPPNMKNLHVCQSNVPILSKKAKMGPNNYNIISEIGKGAYARVVKATLQPDGATSALKVEKPPCLWELYICNEVLKRIPREKLHMFMEVRTAYIFLNGSVLDTEWARYGSLLQAVNTCKVSGRSLDSSIVMFFTIEMLDILDYLHRARIIHGDVKPDNFVLMELPAYHNPLPCVQLIDFGRSIDMTLFPEGTQFTTVVTTDGFQCNEMKEGLPWSYQTDFYGLAGTVYCLLVGEYMKVVKKKNVWTLQKPLLRNVRELWDPFFLELLNIKSSNHLPNLKEMRMNLIAQYSSLDPRNIERHFNSFRNLMNGY